MAVEFDNEQERLIAERAVLTYRLVLAAAEQAAHGRGMAAMEEAIMQHGREQLRQMLVQAVSAHPEAQKKGPAPGPAAAVARPASKTTRPRR